MGQGKKDLERRVVQLETAIRRVDRAIVQLLEIAKASAGLTLAMISALISGQLTDETKAELSRSASDLARSLSLEIGDDDA